MFGMRAVVMPRMWGEVPAFDLGLLAHLSCLRKCCADVAAASGPEVGNCSLGILFDFGWWWKGLMVWPELHWIFLVLLLQRQKSFLLKLLLLRKLQEYFEVYLWR